MQYIKRIQGLNKMNAESKDGYCWMLANWDSVKRIVNKQKKTIKLFRKALLKELGFAPALLFSFKSCYKSKEIFVSRLEKRFS